MKAASVEGNLADLLFDGLLEVDKEGRITGWNKAAERITGHPPREILGRTCQQQPARHVSESGADLPDGLIPLLMTIQDGQRRESIGYLNHADGYRLAILSRTAPIFNDQRKIVGALELFNDNKSLINAFRTAQVTEETIRLDPLTGIGNRPHIETKIRSAIEDFHARKRAFGILFIDVDHFKDFNDRYGHLLGDKILRMAANTLRQNLRGSDSCGRWGGEEFIALVHDLDRPGLAKVAEKLRQSVAQAKMRDEGQKLSVTISIGGSLARPSDDYQALVDRADRLMYASKRRGRDCVTIDEWPETDKADGN